MTDFVVGEFYNVDWGNDDTCCCSHSNDVQVVFIQKFKDDWAEIAYARVDGSICVGYVPYSALSEE